MKYFWLILLLSVVIGASIGWTTNFVQYGRRDAYFGEIDFTGHVTADNVMEHLKQFHSDSSAVAEVDGEATHDFGAMPPNTKGKHTFVIKNTGSEPLTLELGATTCKCTLGSLEDSSVAPGETTSVEMEWTVASDKTTFEQSAELRTNDPSNPAIRLVVMGRIIRDIELEPELISFGEVTVGEPLEMSTKFYNYLDDDIELIEGEFSSESMTELAEVTFEEFELSEADGTHQHANQGFNVVAKVKPGLRQGPMATRLIMVFKKLNEAGEPVGDKLYGSAEVAGKIVGPLSMLENTHLKTTDKGGYYWNLGRLGPDDKKEFKALLALKGSEKDGTSLTIGETYPKGVVSAELGKPIGRGKTRLFPITLKLTAGEETVDLLGKNKEDFGWVWIESDNPKVGRMRVAVKVMIEP
ncbi:DUF1573 domain-containing protein [Roseiconus lacunae]|uniref:DUF1573 domain-containing protein n=1 Tax=Roseiconus lacunae TaxID=2605694 RepID=A0ABT7PCD6_9BACT|nr:DUF1573 domain-containing protein [Roseiconus lacunae]MCD0463597.1 DUF1573 domain-containing protein [Roseiconus lacunae]MDM4013954.1 DUF1573 domain-containing protein [Roseiconus lacunae]WRQ53250.1 DUF1573 domain-containing protein [Stieleria sp. HD01]